MTDLAWDDQGEEYDLKSVMHYDGDAFITEEAWYAGNSTMTYKGTDERVIVWPERADSIDTVQITKRYRFTGHNNSDLKITSSSLHPNRSPLSIGLLVMYAKYLKP